MTQKNDSCETCGLRFEEVGVAASTWCQRCGGPAGRCAGVQKPGKGRVVWHESLVLLAAASAYLFPR